MSRYVHCPMSILTHKHDANINHTLCFISVHFNISLIIHNYPKTLKIRLPVCNFIEPLWFYFSPLTIFIQISRPVSRCVSVMMPMTTLHTHTKPFVFLTSVSVSLTPVPMEGKLCCFCSDKLVRTCSDQTTGS